MNNVIKASVAISLRLGLPSHRLTGVISVFQVTGLKILGRVGTHTFFFWKKYNFMHFER